MNRQTKRDSERIFKTIKKKAVKDMTDWLDALEHHPTPDEILAFKSGYLAGFNRGANNKDA
jgi:molecular chaperone GrpE (heat shock protein)